MAPHSSTLAWKIPWTEDPGGLRSMRSHRVGDDWSASIAYINFEGPFSPSSGEKQYRHLNGWVCPEIRRGLQARRLLEEWLQRIQVPYLPLTTMNLRLHVAFCFSVVSSNRVMMMICKIITYDPWLSPSWIGKAHKIGTHVDIWKGALFENMILNL